MLRPYLYCPLQSQDNIYDRTRNQHKVSKEDGSHKESHQVLIWLFHQSKLRIIELNRIETNTY